MMPIHDRIVPTYFKAIFSTGGCQLIHYICLKRCTHYIKVTILGIEKRKSIMVLTCNNNVLHTCTLCQLNPLISIKSFRIKLVFELIILFNRYLRSSTDPFTMSFLAIPFSCWNRIKAPMNKKPKSRFSPP